MRQATTALTEPEYLVTSHASSCPDGHARDDDEQVPNCTERHQLVVNGLLLLLQTLVCLQVLFYTRMLSDIVGRLVPRKKALAITSPVTLLSLSGALLLAAVGFFVYLQVWPHLAGQQATLCFAPLCLCDVLDMCHAGSVTLHPSTGVSACAVYCCPCMCCCKACFSV